METNKLLVGLETWRKELDGAIPGSHYVMARIAWDAATKRALRALDKLNSEEVTEYSTTAVTCRILRKMIEEDESL